ARDGGEDGEFIAVIQHFFSTNVGQIYRIKQFMIIEQRKFCDDFGESLSGRGFFVQDDPQFPSANFGGGCTEKKYVYLHRPITLSTVVFLPAYFIAPWIGLAADA